MFLGPIPWLIVAEMFDTKYVATAMSISCIVNWVSNFLVGFGFPFMNEYLGAWSFGPFTIVLLIIFLFSYFFLIETLGRSVEEVHRIAMGDESGNVSGRSSRAGSADKLSNVISGVEMELSGRSASTSKKTNTKK